MKFEKYLTYFIPFLLINRVRTLCVANLKKSQPMAELETFSRLIQRRCVTGVVN